MRFTVISFLLFLLLFLFPCHNFLSWFLTTFSFLIPYHRFPSPLLLSFSNPPFLLSSLSCSPVQQCCGSGSVGSVCFGPPGSFCQMYGSCSVSFYHQAKVVRKQPWILLFCSFFMTFFPLKNYVNEASCRLEGHWQIAGTGSVPKCHGSATLFLPSHSCLS